SAGTNKQLSATASGFTNGLSSLFSVSPAAASRLTIQSQPSATATAGVIFAQQPVIRVEDSFGNLRTGDNTTVVTTSRNGGSGVLQGSAALNAVNGLVSFTNLSHLVATTITIDFASAGVAGTTSANIAVSPAPASKLTLLTQPSSTAIAGVVFAQQPVIRIEDPYGNLRASDNSTVVTATRNAGSGVLQGTTSLGAVNGLVSFTNLSHNVATTISIDFASPGLPGAPATSASVVVSPGAFSKLQLLAPGETAAPGISSVKSGTPNSQSAATPFSV